MARPRTYVDAPPVTPLPYGLLSVATVLDDLTDTRALGVEYEPGYCGAAYDANGVCQDDPDLGTLSVSVDAAAGATITAAGAPGGTTYTIDWGDDTSDDVADPDAATHTYAAPGTYVVLVTDNSVGYVARAVVTVTDAAASGPFDADVAYSRVDSTGIDLVDGEPFSLYHLFSCSPVGLSEADFNERVRAALRTGEQRGLERVTASRLATHAGAVDLTPAGGAVHPVEGLARLQRWASQNYGGVPVVHANVDAVTALDHYAVVQHNGNRTGLETMHGARVTSAAGYDTLAGPQTDAQDPDTVQPAGDGQAWLYVTGQVVVHRSPVIEVGPVMDRAPAALNVRTGLAERLYTSTWECITGAVLVDLYGGL